MECIGSTILPSLFFSTVRLSGKTTGSVSDVGMYVGFSGRTVSRRTCDDEQNPETILRLETRLTCGRPLLRRRTDWTSVPIGILTNHRKIRVYLRHSPNSLDVRRVRRARHGLCELGYRRQTLDIMYVMATLKSLPFFQVDAFARQVFGGNPAAVCVLQEWLPDALMQSVAEENDFSATAFVIVQVDGLCRIRWFTPSTELELCGHATLAAAHVVLQFVRPDMQSVRFLSSGGVLGVHREAEGGRLYLNFPALGTEPAQLPRESLMAALGLGEMGDVFRSHYDVMVVLGDEEAVANLSPRLSKIRRFDARGFIVTSVGRSVDFVSRFFAPRIGIDEDPVCGSAHSVLVPYWSRRLGKTKLFAKQLSKRGGELYCEDLRNGRVELGGYATLFARGEIFLSS